MKRLLKILLAVVMVGSTVFSATGALASAIVIKPDVVKNLQVSKTTNNNYTIQVGANSIPLGSATGSFTPKMVFPDWAGYAWNAQLGLTMAVTANALATAGMTSSFTSTSVTASNSYFNITYSGVAVNPPFNETGGLDMSISILKNIGTTLAFGYNPTNVNAYLQPSLTKEWTVGQVLGNGNTVTSVTDTDVTDNLGNNVAHRPIYVVNSIALYSSTGGGMVSTAQAATGYTTGQIGMLYRMNLTGANGVTAWADWSIPNGTNLWLNLNTAGMTYPIVISPAGDTFGYTTAGSSNQGAISIGYLGFNLNGIAGAAGTGVSMSWYGAAGGYSGSDYIEMAIYTLSAGTYSPITNPGTVQSAKLPYNNGAWITCNFTVAPTLTATTYYLMVNDTGTEGRAKWYNSVAGQSVKYHAQTYGSWGAFSSPGNDSTNYQMSIYCTYTAGGGVSITNSPSSLAFGTVMPGTTYYAYNQSTGSYPNPVTSSQCYFTITNAGGSSVNLALSCTNATSGNTWTLVSGTPSGDQFEVIAVYNGENPASGLVLTNSNQSFYSALAASGTLLWDFKEVLGGTGTGKSGTFSDAATKTYTITITGS